MNKNKLTSYLEEKSKKGTTRSIVDALVSDGFEVIDNTDVRRVYLKGYDVILKVQRAIKPPHLENLAEHEISVKVAGTPLESTFIPVLASTQNHRIIAMPYHDTLSSEEGRGEAYKSFERHMCSSPKDLYLTRPGSTVVGTGAQLHYEYHRHLPECIDSLN